MRPVLERFCARAFSRQSVLVALAVALAGCSPEVTRFSDNPFANPFTARPGSLEPTGSVAAGQPAPVARVERASLGPQSAALPPPLPSTALSYHTPASPESPTPVPAGPTGSPLMKDGGRAITVAQGDTIDSISRRYGVPASAIMRANSITAPASIRLGQHLTIPRANYATASATSSPVGGATAATAQGPRAPSEQTHVVAPGETLSSIARQYHRPRLGLAKANSIDADSKLKIGQQLVIPGTKHALLPHPPTAAVAASEVSPFKPGPASPAAPKTAASATGARAVTPTSELDSAASNLETTGTAASFRWPVHGKIIAGFGSKSNGQQNDGINLAVPEGTPVKAAEDGVVAYAGSELRGYGNLVLVRHANGFVTAYANANELMVKRGDQVKRGQVIAHSGQTGSVTSPQLHFEIRKGATPVDPTQYLSGT